MLLYFRSSAYFIIAVVDIASEQHLLSVADADTNQLRVSPHKDFGDYDLKCANRTYLLTYLLTNLFNHASHTQHRLVFRWGVSYFYKLS